MMLRTLVGSGHKITAATLPFAAAAIAANVIWPHVFALNLGRTPVAVGAALLAVGVPIWLTSAVQVAVHVPRGKLITTGPFAVARHPLYTSVALLVIPGAGLLFHSWIGVPIGAVLYAFARAWSGEEEQALRAAFPADYERYRSRVLLPWL